MIRSSILLAGVFCGGGILQCQAQVLDVIEQANRYTIKITTAVDYPFGTDKKGSLRGSGFLVDKERGWFHTNAHVSSKSPSSMRASFKDRPYVAVEKVYVDNHLDLAVIKMDPSKIPANAEPAKLQCDGEAQAGRAVIAYGHPWGLDFTATRGIISGTKPRDGEEKLQTDAALNPGNSGGALIDAERGVIVGINSSGFAKNVAEGLNFAVPAPLACRILELLRQGKNPAPPTLPLDFATTTKDRELVIAQVRGDWVGKVQPGDRVLAVNGDETARLGSRVLSHMRGASTISLKVRRGEGTEDVSLNVPATLDEVKRAGVHASGMVVGRSTVTGYDQSVMWIQFVDDASIAEQSQINEGDQLISVNSVNVRSLDEVYSALRGVDRKEVEIIIRRPKFTLISGRYEYLVRNLEVKNVFEVDQNGRKN